MNDLWKSIIVTDIGTAVYVAPGAGKHIHKNRPFHGLVLNDATVKRDYCFADGHILHTEGNCLFYLPKGSSYFVKTIEHGGCWAINFDAEIADRPFCISLQAHEQLLQRFKNAASMWKSNSDLRKIAATRTIYEAIYEAQRELQHQSYLPSRRTQALLPAIEVLNRDFSDNTLCVSRLAALCGMSEVYFRRLFLRCFGVSPKEYIIQKRMDYAKTLLSSESFSVARVAALCGYAEPCHFSREFTKRVGMPPSQY